MQDQPLKQPVSRQIFNDDGEVVSAVFCLVCNHINYPEAEVYQRCGKILTNEPSPIRSTLLRVAQHNRAYSDRIREHESQIDERNIFFRQSTLLSLIVLLITLQVLAAAIWFMSKFGDPG